MNPLLTITLTSGLFVLLGLLTRERVPRESSADPRADARARTDEQGCGACSAVCDHREEPHD